MTRRPHRVGNAVPTRQQHLRPVAAAIGLLLLASAASAAAPVARSTLTDLGTLGGDNSYGFGINVSGQVTAYSLVAGSTAAHAFISSNGVMGDLGTPGGSQSMGYAINDAGQVAGSAFNAAGRGRLP